MNTKKVGRPAKKALCHPDREHFQKALCLECYLAAGNPKVRMATCHPRRKHGSNGLCSPCYMSLWSKTHPNHNSGAGWRKRNPDKAWRIHKRAYLKTLGITVEEYDALWITQKGKCANPRCTITFNVELRGTRSTRENIWEKPFLDHDHKTNKTRGLLCGGCNTALGYVKDDPERLLGLAEYIKSRVA